MILGKYELVTPKRQRLAPEIRRHQLLELGRRLFSEDSYDAVTVEAIVERAGISTGLFYHYFESKHRYYVEAVRHAANQLSAAIVPTPGLPFLEAVRGSLHRFLGFVRDNAPAYRSVLRGGPGHDPEIEAIVDGVRRLVGVLVIGYLGIREAPPRLRTFLYGWAGFNEVASLQWIERGDLSEDEMVEVSLAALEPGLRMIGELALGGNGARG